MATILTLSIFQIPLAKSMYSWIFGLFSSCWTCSLSESLINSNTTYLGHSLFSIQLENLSYHFGLGELWSLFLWALSNVFLGLLVDCTDFNDPRDIFGGLLPFLVAIAWLYTKIRPIPIPSPPRPIFYLLVLCRIGGISTIMSSVFHGLPQ